MLSRTREKGLSFFISANFMTVALVVAHLLSSRPGLQPSASIGISITSISETLQRHPQQFGCTLPSPLMSGYHLSTSLDYELLFCFPNPRSQEWVLRSCYLCCSFHCFEKADNLHQHLVDFWIRDLGRTFLSTIISSPGSCGSIYLVYTLLYFSALYVLLLFTNMY